jgi:hypothetical protein
MPVRFECPHCHSRYTFAEGFRRTSLKCASCGRTFPVRAAPEAVAVAEDIPDALPASRAPIPQPPPGLPFSLQRGERILLGGGFGGAGWAWTAALLLPSLCCMSPALVVLSVAGLQDSHVLGLLLSGGMLAGLLLLASWPWLRSGRYWLTTQRLVWKPRLGRIQVLSLAEIPADRVSAGPITSTVRIRGRRPMALRYVGGAERLWGGILLLTQAGGYDLPPEGAGMAELAWWRGYRVGGLSSQAGVVILRPEYVAFLPSQESKNLLAMAATEMASSAVGLQRVTIEASYPFDVLLGVLADRDPRHFDRWVRKAVERHGGRLWGRVGVKVSREGIPVAPRSEAVVFSHDGITLRGKPPRDQRPAALRLLESWFGGIPIPKTYPYVRVGLLAAFFAALAVGFVAVGRHFREPVVDLGSVGPGQVMDREAVPEGAFLTLSGHPDLRHAMLLKAEGKSDDRAVLIVFKEAPQLVLYVKAEHPLNELLRRQSAKNRPADPKRREELKKEWTVSGRLYADGEDGWPHVRIPVASVRKFVSDDLKLAGTGDSRVLVVGMKGEDLSWNSQVAYGFAVAFAVVALLVGSFLPWMFLHAWGDRRS